MRTECPEFAPLDLERATELEEIINTAGQAKQPVFIDPDEEGITSPEPEDLISPNENTNGLVRYQRHYRPGAARS